MDVLLHACVCVRACVRVWCGCVCVIDLDWTQRVYHESSVSTFPPDLAQLSTQLATASGYTRSFEAQAAIVNFYTLNSTLGGHLDDSEFDVGAPIISIR